MYDPKLVFIRKNKEVEYDRCRLKVNFYFGFKRIDKKIYFYRTFIIGFCGELYLGLKYRSSISYDTCFIENFINKEEEVSYFNKKWRHSYLSFYGKFSPLNINRNLKKIFYSEKVPYFSLEETYYLRSRETVLTFVPLLKKYKFYKVYDSCSAFQEISMFFGNNLSKERQGNIPTGNDEVLARSKGFDKWSFRKEGKKS